MRKGELRKLVSVAGRILLAFLFVFSESAWAGQDPKAKDNPKTAPKAAVQQTGEKPSSAATAAKTQTEEGQAETSEKSSAEEKPSGDGKHEGIKVHGHWTIEVRNPDGTVATHREFENSLIKSTPSGLAGDYLLVAMLGRGLTPGAWQVRLSGPNGGLCPRGGQSGFCIIGELGGNIDSTNLLVTPTSYPSVGAGTFPPTLTLSGTVVSVPSAGTVAVVETDAFTCSGSSSPYGCLSTGGGSLFLQFTSAPVNPSVAVAAGQTLAVTVVFTFS